uniref:FTH domain-containing protein n=2 Tax=Steinernema glaseri TaxID=37863 RepID=A0A1I7ZZE1_9BILA
MDAVPCLFIEHVCLCLRHRDNLRESGKLPSLWGKVCSATIPKIHTLKILVNESKIKLYVAAHSTSLHRLLEDIDFVSNDVIELARMISATPLDSVEPKFITNFHIEPCHYEMKDFRYNWKEITLDKLERLIRFIRPTVEHIHPSSFDQESSNFWRITAGREFYIYRKLLSMRLPVDSVSLVIEHVSDMAEVNEFFENSGPLYRVESDAIFLKPNIVDAMIDKFVPVDGGEFILRQPLNKKQLERLVVKCEMSKKKVTLRTSRLEYY